MANLIITEIICHKDDLVHVTRDDGELDLGRVAPLASDAKLETVGNYARISFLAPQNTISNHAIANMKITFSHPFHIECADEAYPETFFCPLSDEQHAAGDSELFEPKPSDWNNSFLVCGDPKPLSEEDIAGILGE